MQKKDHPFLTIKSFYLKIYLYFIKNIGRFKILKSPKFNFKKSKGGHACKCKIYIKKEIKLLIFGGILILPYFRYKIHFLFSLKLHFFPKIQFQAKLTCPTLCLQRCQFVSPALPASFPRPNSAQKTSSQQTLPLQKCSGSPNPNPSQTLH